jgi:hypothetical protein
MEIAEAQIKKYLSEKFGPDMKINEFKQLGKGVYGTAYLIDFDTVEGNKRLVLKTMGKGGYGHDYFSDIASNLLYDNAVFNKLPKHVKSYDVVAVEDEKLVPVGSARDFYILLEEAKGVEYHNDLDRILREGLQDSDVEKVNIMADYLAEIHSIKQDAPELYIRRARDLVGHGEYIMGVLDGYPIDLFRKERKEIGRKCIDWWDKLKDYTNRLCQVHGDFHPYNIMWQEHDFITLDRSRGELGEPADDTTALTMNYIFWSLTKHGKLAGDFEKLFETFFDRYLVKSSDKEMLEVLQPYFAFRAIVVANPTFYPDKWFEERGADALETRKKLFSFARTILDFDKVDLKGVNSLF